MALRVALLGLGATALLTGLCGGLWRLGFDVPHAARPGELHGPLLICGLFGTLIGLERAVALGRDGAFLAPAFAGLGTLALLAGAPPAVGAIAYALAAATLSIATLVITVKQPAIFNATLVLAALSWLVGDLVWLTGGSVPQGAGWWLGFLVLTIAGERLELSRLTERKRGSEALFLLAVALFAAGAQNGLLSDNGAMLTGLALVLLTGWLVRHDVVRHTVRQAGQTRFMALAMLGGYGWLGVAGALLVAFPPASATFGYDAALHAILIGFVLSMVFGHALIILPAVARVRVAYTPVLYVPLALLHASLALRIAGDLVGSQDLRLWSGPLTLVALAGFVGTIVTGVMRSRRNRRGAVRPAPAATTARPPARAFRHRLPPPSGWRGSAGRSLPR